jgi:hypothetical protein
MRVEAVEKALLEVADRLDQPFTSRGEPAGLSPEEVL